MVKGIVKAFWWNIKQVSNDLPFKLYHKIISTLDVQSPIQLTILVILSKQSYRLDQLVVV